jgi:hypothetical protein
MPIVTTLVLAAIFFQTGSLQFTPPASWKPRPSASAMRIAEFAVPRAPGDSEDAEVVIFYFGGSGGSVDANIERWVGQFQAANGGPVPTPQRTASAVGNVKVTAIDVSGTYVAEVRPGSPERFHKPDFRMRAAVVETAQGPYFVKFTGPATTVSRALESGEFDRFVASLRLSSSAAGAIHEMSRR